MVNLAWIKLRNLTCDEITKTDSREGDERVVNSFLVGPFLKVREYERRKEDEHDEARNQIHEDLYR